MSKQKRIKEFNDQGKHFIIEARTHKQRYYLQALKTDSVIIGIGCAGTGKTFCAAAYAAQELASHHIDKIILTRANVPTGKSIGYFPGDISEKLTPWLAPVLSVIKDVLGKGQYDYELKKDKIELVPLEVIRGRSWDNAIILIDEAQNLSIEELKAISTRIGQNSKMVFMGDASQSDLKNGQDNDLNKFIELIEKYGISNTTIVEFGIDDIVRSDMCAAFVEAFHREGI